MEKMQSREMSWHWIGTVEAICLPASEGDDLMQLLDPSTESLGPYLQPFLHGNFLLLLADGQIVRIPSVVCG